MVPVPSAIHSQNFKTILRDTSTPVTYVYVHMYVSMCVYTYDLIIFGIFSNLLFVMKDQLIQEYHTVQLNVCLTFACMCY